MFSKEGNKVEHHYPCSPMMRKGLERIERVNIWDVCYGRVLKAMTNLGKFENKVFTRFPGPQTSLWNPYLLSRIVWGTLEDTLVEYTFLCSRDWNAARQGGRPCGLPSPVFFVFVWHVSDTLWEGVFQSYCVNGVNSATVLWGLQETLKVLKYNFCGAKTQNALAEVFMPANFRKEKSFVSSQLLTALFVLISMVSKLRLLFHKYWGIFMESWLKSVNSFEIFEFCFEKSLTRSCSNFLHKIKLWINIRKRQGSGGVAQGQSACLGMCKALGLIPSITKNKAQYKTIDFGLKRASYKVIYNKDIVRHWDIKNRIHLLKVIINTIASVLLTTQRPEDINSQTWTDFLPCQWSNDVLPARLTGSTWNEHKSKQASCCPRESQQDGSFNHLE